RRSGGDQSANPADTGPTMEDGFRTRAGSAHTGKGARARGNERRIELAGIHAGGLVEPHSPGSMGPDVGNCVARPCAGRVWGAQGHVEAVYDASAGGVDLVFPDRRYRQPATWSDPGQSAEPHESAGGVEVAYCW